MHFPAREKTDGVLSESLLTVITSLFFYSVLVSVVLLFVICVYGEMGGAISIALKTDRSQKG